MDENSQTKDDATLEIGLAQAIFDNDSEWPDELEFRKGDLLRVKQQENSGTDGWWLVTDKSGRSGIAPANRLKMMHRFRPPENRVITPQRFGDIFVYGNETGGGSTLDDPNFRATLEAFRTSSPSPLNSFTLLHDSEHPFVATNNSSRSSSIVRDIPIKIEGTRKSPPPPPQRRYFHSFNASSNAGVSSGSASEDTSKPEPVYNTPLRSQYNGTSINGLMYKKPSTLLTTPPTSTWRTKSNTKSTTATDTTPPDQRDSISSSVSASPQGESERSSSMSEPDSTRSSYLDDSAYKQPPSRNFVSNVHSQPTPTTPPAPTLPPRSTLTDRMWPSSGRPTGAVRQDARADVRGDVRLDAVAKMRADEKAATALLNVLEDLYDSPRNHSSASLKAPMTYKQLRQEIDRSNNSVGRLPIITPERSISIPQSPVTVQTAVQPAVQTRLGTVGNTVSPSPAAFNQATSSSQLYDAPRPRQGSFGSSGVPDLPDRPPPPMEKLPADLERLSVSSMDSKDDDFQVLLLNACEIHLTPTAALIELTQRLQDLQSSIALLSSFSAKKNWRRRIILAQTIADMRVSVNQVSKNMEIFLDFASGALLNSTRSELCKKASSNIAKRLAHLMRPLKDGQEMFDRKKADLSRMGWTVNVLARDENNVQSNDALDQLIAVAQQAPQDCRQVVAFLQGNASLIFCPSHLAPSNGNSSQNSSHLSSSEDEMTNLGRNGNGTGYAAGNGYEGRNSVTNNTNSNGALFNGHEGNGRIIEEDELDTVMSAASSQRSLLDDYDFVDNMAGKKEMEHRLSQNTITNESVNSSVDREDSTTPTAEFSGNNNNNNNKTISNSNGNVSINGNGSYDSNGTEVVLGVEDVEIVQFYQPQVDAHMQYVSGAIEDFLTAIEANKPPREFVQKSKLVILGAHKLVYIGDSVVQCVRNLEVSEQLRLLADRLCSELKLCVANTKQAATLYPQVQAVQAMVDSMVAVSHAAHKLKLLMRKVANNHKNSSS